MHRDTYLRCQSRRREPLRLHEFLEKNLTRVHGSLHDVLNTSYVRQCQGPSEARGPLAGSTIQEAERDGELPKKLALELPGILAWSVRGCLEWQKAGLSTPAAVNEATGTYRSENDALGEFFRLSVRFESDVSLARKDLREAYESFCRENGNEPLGAKRFSGRLRERGVREGSVRKGQSVVNGWKNVRLLTDAERATATNWGGTPAVVHTNGSHVEPTPSPDNYEPARDDDDAPRAEMSQDTLSDWLATQGIRPKE